MSNHNGDLMINFPIVLVDSSVLIAFYNSNDRYHIQVREYFASTTSRLVTTVACITEVMYLLASNWRIQNLFLADLQRQIYRCENLIPDDFARIAVLNEQCADLPGDFADLSLIVISERLGIDAIATLDKDFDVYRRYRRQPFIRAFLPRTQ